MRFRIRSGFSRLTASGSTKITMKTRILCGLALALTGLNVQAQSEPKLTYGVSAMSPGPVVATAPTIDQPLNQWTTSPKLDQFYKVGGEGGAL